MGKEKARFFWAGILALSFSTVHAQTPQQIIQQAVDAERTADQNDHSNWVYLEEKRQAKRSHFAVGRRHPTGECRTRPGKGRTRAAGGRTAGTHSKISARLPEPRRSRSKRAITIISRSMTCSSFCPLPLSGHKQGQPQPPPHCTSNLRQPSIHPRARLASSAAWPATWSSITSNTASAKSRATLSMT